MFLKLVLFILFLEGFVTSQQEDPNFTYNGFQGVNMSLDGLAQITDNGLLMLTNTTLQQVGHAFYPYPIHFMNFSTGTALSFSTTFVFAMFSELTTLGGPGFALAIAPSKDALPESYLGLFNTTNIGKSSNHILAIELDSLQTVEFNETDGNHVGIDINDLKSAKSATASYFSDEENRNVNLSLISGKPLQLWVEYSGSVKQLNVTLAPINVPKPTIPLLSFRVDLSKIIMDSMFLGFSSNTYAFPASYYILGWSFKMNGKARELNLSQLPKLPHQKRRHKTSPRVFSVGFSMMVATAVLILIFLIRFIVKRKRKFAEVLEDWELDYGSYRFKYKDLYIATKGFKDKELLGTGGFGWVYRGVLPTSKTKVAVKRVSHNSRQGEREFVAEIVSIGKLRHRSIVTLLGYCRRKEELLLVYDFMPNGSLDKLLFDQTTPKMVLSWYQRFRIIKSIATALSYLHEEWEQVVVHRDIKSSNVLLDKELNGRLGDFGLARLYDHGTDPQTTHVVGTIGYLAPELSKTGKANPRTDVFSFGVFLLEVVCGRRSIEPEASEECMVLVDWVVSCWCKGTILDTVDPKLGRNYEAKEMELVLKLGLLCSHSIPISRPNMRQVVRYLEGEGPLPELPSLYRRIVKKELTSVPSDGFSGVSVCGSSVGNVITRSSSIAESVLSGGR